MKIIFDSEEQKAEFIKCHCPDGMNCSLTNANVWSYNTNEGCIAIIPCSYCWEQSGVEMEVKKDE